MKNIFTVLAMLISLAANAQYSPATGSFDVSQGELTTELLNVSGTIFQVYKSRFGKYVVTVSRHGKLTPRFIGEATGEYYNNHPVRVLKTGSELWMSLNSLGKLEINYLVKN